MIETFPAEKSIYHHYEIDAKEDENRNPIEEANTTQQRGCFQFCSTCFISSRSFPKTHTIISYEKK